MWQENKFSYSFFRSCQYNITSPIYFVKLVFANNVGLNIHFDLFCITKIYLSSHVFLIFHWSWLTLGFLKPVFLSLVPKLWEEAMIWPPATNKASHQIFQKMWREKRQKQVKEKDIMIQNKTFCLPNQLKTKHNWMQLTRKKRFIQKKKLLAGGRNCFKEISSLFHWKCRNIWERLFVLFLHLVLFLLLLLLLLLHLYIWVKDLTNLSHYMCLIISDFVHCVGMGVARCDGENNHRVASEQ